MKINIAIAIHDKHLRVCLPSQSTHCFSNIDLNNYVFFHRFLIGYSSAPPHLVVFVHTNRAIFIADQSYIAASGHSFDGGVKYQPRIFADKRAGPICIVQTGGGEVDLHACISSLHACVLAFSRRQA
jgi:hypothetical protein